MTTAPTEVSTFALVKAHALYERFVGPPPRCRPGAPLGRRTLCEQPADADPHQGIRHQAALDDTDGRAEQRVDHAGRPFRGGQGTNTLVVRWYAR